MEIAADAGMSRRSEVIFFVLELSRLKIGQGNRIWNL